MGKYKPLTTLSERKEEGPNTWNTCVHRCTYFIHTYIQIFLYGNRIIAFVVPDFQGNLIPVWKLCLWLLAGSKQVMDEFRLQGYLWYAWTWAQSLCVEVCLRVLRMICNAVPIPSEWKNLWNTSICESWLFFFLFGTVYYYGYFMESI